MKKQHRYTEAELQAAHAALATLKEEVNILGETVDQIFALVVAKTQNDNALNNLTYILKNGKGRATQGQE